MKSNGIKPIAIRNPDFSNYMNAYLLCAKSRENGLLAQKEKELLPSAETPRVGFNRDSLQGQGQTKKWLLAACVINLSKDEVLRFKVKI